jgi:methionine synthase II (cobalamin-independent)
MKIKKSKLNQIVLEEITNYKKSYSIDEQLLEDIASFIQYNNKILYENKYSINKILNLYLEHKNKELKNKLDVPEQIEAIKHIINEINKK